MVLELTIYRHTYADGDEEVVTEGSNPDRTDQQDEHPSHDLESPFRVGDDENEEGQSDASTDELGQNQPWDRRRFAESETRSHDYGSFHEERSAWDK